VDIPEYGAQPQFIIHPSYRGRLAKKTRGETPPHIFTDRITEYFMETFDWQTWVILPLFVFIARLIDVTRRSGGR
jgi:hypothetical protein